MAHKRNNIDVPETYPITNVPDNTRTVIVLCKYNDTGKIITAARYYKDNKWYSAMSGVQVTPNNANCTYLWVESPFLTLN